MPETTHEPRRKRTTTEDPGPGKQDTSPEPRTIDEIRKEALGVWAQAGEVQYEIKQKQRLLDQVNLRLEYLNSEANEREALDKTRAAAQAKENIRKAEEKNKRKGKARTCSEN